MGSGLLRSMRVPGLQHADSRAFRGSIANFSVRSTDRCSPLTCHSAVQVLWLRQRAFMI